MTLFLISQVPFFSFFISFAKTLPLTILKMKFLTQQVALDKSFSDETDYRNSIKDEITFFLSATKSMSLNYNGKPLFK